MWKTKSAIVSCHSAIWGPCSSLFVGSTSHGEIWSDLISDLCSISSSLLLTMPHFPLLLHEELVSAFKVPSSLHSCPPKVPSQGTLRPTMHCSTLPNCNALFVSLLVYYLPSLMDHKLCEGRDHAYFWCYQDRYLPNGCWKSEQVSDSLSHRIHEVWGMKVREEPITVADPQSPLLCSLWDWLVCTGQRQEDGTNNYPINTKK